MFPIGNCVPILSHGRKSPLTVTYNLLAPGIQQPFNEY